MRRRTPPDPPAGTADRRRTVAAAAGAAASGDDAPAALRYLVHVVPGLEAVTAGEIAERMPAAVPGRSWRRFDERTSVLEYRAAGSPRFWLGLATAEDVFVVAAQGRELRPDAAGLGQLTAAVAGARQLDAAVRAFTACRRAGGGAPRTFRVVARKAGAHGFRRVDAQRAVERALQARLPKLRLVDDDADAEFWLTLVGDVALVALRLSTPGMRQGRHRPVSVPASLKPTIARAMVRLSGPRETDVVLDPFCGAGTLLLERAHAGPFASLIGGDRDPATVAVARTNVRASGLPVEISEWDARALPLPDRSVDVVLSNPPFGKKIRIEGGAADPFYREFLAEARRVLRPAGRLVLITNQVDAFTEAVKQLSPPLAVTTQVPLLVRGERAVVFVATTPSAAVAASAKGSPRRKDPHGSVQLPDPGTP